MTNVMMFWQFRIACLFLLVFIFLFLPLRYSKKVSALCLAGCYLIETVMDYLYLINGGHQRTAIWYTVAEIAVLQVMPFVVGRYRDFRAMFVGFTASAYVVGGSAASTLLYILGADLAICLVSQCVIQIAILWILVKKTRESFLRLLSEPGLQWGWLCIIPALFYVAVHAISMWPANVYQNPENMPAIWCIVALMIISYVMIFQISEQTREEWERQKSAEYFENYAKYIKREADTIREKEKEAAIVRHDLKHYSILINDYLEQDKKEEIRGLLRELNEQVREKNHVRYCANLAVNGIVAHGARRAENGGVRFETQMEIPQELKMNEMELATVVSNLLENAINAALLAKEEEARFVRIAAHGIGDKLVLQIVNGCQEAPQISKTTGYPIFEGKKNHGYGMQSVRAFVKKYNALIDFQVDQQTFSVKLAVKLTNGEK